MLVRDEGYNGSMDPRIPRTMFVKLNIGLFKNVMGGICFWRVVFLAMVVAWGTPQSFGAVGGIPWTGSPPIKGETVQPPNLLPLEPAEFDDREVKAYYDQRNDMFFRLFDIKGLGFVDYMTARRTYKVWLDEFGTPVVMAVAEPVFYWLDVDGNGEFEQSKGEMWSDPEEDGVTGNEKIYDSSDLQQGLSSIPMWSAPTPQPNEPLP